MSLVSLATAVLLEPLLLRRRQRRAMEVGVLREIVTCVASVARPDSAASPRPSSVSAKSSVGVLVLGSPFRVQRVKALGPAPPEPAVWTTVVLAKITYRDGDVALTDNTNVTVATLSNLAAGS